MYIANFAQKDSLKKYMHLAKQCTHGPLIIQGKQKNLQKEELMELLLITQIF